MTESNEKIFVSRGEALLLMNCSRQGLDRKRKRGELETRETVKQGGKTFEYALNSLPSKAQARYWKKRINDRGPNGKAKPHTTDALTHQLASTHSTNRKLAMKRIRVLHATKGMTRKSLEEFIGHWNEGNPSDTISLSSIYDWRKTEAMHGKTELVGRYGKTNGSSLVFDYVNQDDPLSIKQHEILGACYTAFDNQFMIDGSPSAEKCWQTSHGLWKELSGGCEELLDGSPFPAVDTFLRRLKNNKPQDVLDYARRGKEYWNRTWAKFLDRDLTDIQPGEIWISDHHQVDVACLDDGVNFISNFAEGSKRLGKTKKDLPVLFPWLTVFQDLRTGMVLGWSLHTKAPNSDHIFQAFHHAASRYGIPAALIIDNGKDYRCKDFSGGRVSKIKPNINKAAAQSLLASLGIEVHFAKPYQAQTKLCERYFRYVKEDFGKVAIGYRGGHAKERPERLEGEIKHGEVYSRERLCNALDNFIETVLNTTKSKGSKHLLGLSPMQAWSEFRTQEGYTPRTVSSESLMLLCTRVGEVKQLRKNGYYDPQMNRWYFAEWMFGHYGKKVFIRRDPRAWEIAYVFEAKTEKFLGMAKLVRTVKGLAKTDIDREELRSQLAGQKRHQKMVRELAKSEPMSIERVNELRAIHNNGSAGSVNPGENGSDVLHTWADDVIEQEQKMKRTGTNDFPYYYEPEKPRVKLAHFESDLEYDDE